MADPLYFIDPELICPKENQLDKLSKLADHIESKKEFILQSIIYKESNDRNKVFSYIHPLNKDMKNIQWLVHKTKLRKHFILSSSINNFDKGLLKISKDKKRSVSYIYYGSLIAAIFLIVFMLLNKIYFKSDLNEKVRIVTSKNNDLNKEILHKSPEKIVHKNKIKDNQYNSFTDLIPKNFFPKMSYQKKDQVKFIPEEKNESDQNHIDTQHNLIIKKDKKNKSDRNKSNKGINFPLREMPRLVEKKHTNQSILDFIINEESKFYSKSPRIDDIIIVQSKIKTSVGKHKSQIILVKDEVKKYIYDVHFLNHLTYKGFIASSYSKILMKEQLSILKKYNAVIMLFAIKISQYQNLLSMNRKPSKTLSDQIVFLCNILQIRPILNDPYDIRISIINQYNYRSLGFLKTGQILYILSNPSKLDQKKIKRSLKLIKSAIKLLKKDYKFLIYFLEDIQSLLVNLKSSSEKKHLQKVLDNLIDNLKIKYLIK